MNICARNVRRYHEVDVRQVEVALGIRRRDRALIHEEDMDASPRERMSGEVLEQQLGRRTSRDREGGVLLAPERLFQKREDVVRSGSGSACGVSGNVPAYTHSFSFGTS